MASSKSLFFVAFALAATILSVNSSPLIPEASQQLVASKALLRDQEIVDGSPKPGDYVAREVKVHVQYSTLEEEETVSVSRKVVLLPGEKITAVWVTNEEHNLPDSGASVSIYSGGIGDQYVVINFENSAGSRSRIHYKIALWATNV